MPSEGLMVLLNVEVDDSSGAIRRCESRCRAAFQLELAQVVVLDDPRVCLLGPAEQRLTPTRRERHSERRLLARCYDRRWAWRRRSSLLRCSSPGRPPRPGPYEFPQAKAPIA